MRIPDIISCVAYEEITVGQDGDIAYGEEIQTMLNTL